MAAYSFCASLRGKSLQSLFLTTSSFIKRLWNCNQRTREIYRQCARQHLPTNQPLAGAFLALPVSWRCKCNCRCVRAGHASAAGCLRDEPSADVCCVRRSFGKVALASEATCPTVLTRTPHVATPETQPPPATLEITLLPNADKGRPNSTSRVIPAPGWPWLPNLACSQELRPESRNRNLSPASKCHCKLYNSNRFNESFTNSCSNKTVVSTVQRCKEVSKCTTFVRQQMPIPFNSNSNFQAALVLKETLQRPWKSLRNESNLSNFENRTKTGVKWNTASILMLSIPLSILINFSPDMCAMWKR